MFYNWMEPGDHDKVLFYGSISEAAAMVKSQAANVPIWEAVSLVAQLPNHRFMLAQAINMNGKITLTVKTFSYGMNSPSTRADNYRRYETYYSHTARFNERVATLHKMIDIGNGQYTEYAKKVLTFMGFSF